MSCLYSEGLTSGAIFLSGSEAKPTRSEKVGGGIIFDFRDEKKLAQLCTAASAIIT
jgi:hypothetical protein